MSDKKKNLEKITGDATNSTGLDEMLKISINNKILYSQPGRSVLEICLENDIFVPNLCNDPRLRPQGACRLCVVEIEGVPGVSASCVTQVKDSMKIRTDT